MTEQPVDERRTFYCPFCGGETESTTLADLLETTMAHRPPRTGALAEWLLFVLCVLILGAIMVGVMIWVMG